MAGAGVAPGPHEDRQHIESEAEVGSLGGPLDVNGNGDGLSAERHGELRVAVGDGQEHVAVKTRLGGVCDGHGRLGGDVAGQPVGLDHLHDE